MKRKVLCSVASILLILCLSLLTVGCAKNAPSDYGSEREASGKYSNFASEYNDGSMLAEFPEDLKKAAKDDLDDGRKLIKTYAIYAESKEFDDGLDFLDSILKRLGGYYQSKRIDSDSVRYYYSDSTSNRVAYFVLRIPAEQADGFIASLKEKFNVTRSEETTTDVTLSYSDVEGHLSALKAQEARLIEMMASAQTLSDLIALDDKLTDVRYEIESYEKQLRNYDNQIEYVTVDMSLREVKELTVSETTFWDDLVSEVSYAFKELGEGCKDFVIWFVAAQPTLILLGVIGLVIFLIIRGIVKNSQKRKKANAAAKTASDRDAKNE